MCTNIIALLLYYLSVRTKKMLHCILNCHSTICISSPAHNYIMKRSTHSSPTHETKHNATNITYKSAWTSKLLATPANVLPLPQSVYSIPKHRVSDPKATSRNVRSPGATNGKRTAKTGRNATACSTVRKEGTKTASEAKTCCKRGTQLLRGHVTDLREDPFARKHALFST